MMRNHIAKGGISVFFFFVVIAIAAVGRCGDLPDERSIARVQSVVRKPAAEKVFNFRVRGTSTYAVGASGVLVHNNNDCLDRLLDIARNCPFADFSALSV